MTNLCGTEIPLDPGFMTKTSQIQLFYGMWVNVLQLSIGLAFGLPAVQVPQLSSSDSELRITRSEAAWIASVLTLFAPIGCLISGIIIDSHGRRLMVILCQLPMLIGWLYTSFAKSSKNIIIGRAITGVGCGMAMAPSRIYSTEITLPNMRGVVGGLHGLAFSIGIGIQAGLGQFFKWQILCHFSSAFAIVNFLLYTRLPETPYYVLKTRSEEEARITLAKFRGPEYDLNKEMNELIDFKKDNDIRELTLLQQMQALFTKSSCKPFMLINLYLIFAQASGVSCILMWAVEMLIVANSAINPNTGNFLMAVTRLVAGVITSVLLYRVGRKPLALTSAIGISFMSLTLGFYLFYHEEPSVVPVTCFMFYMFFATLGYNVLPFLMASELYPLQVRGVLTGMTVALACFLVFGSVKAYPYLLDFLGLSNVFVSFGVISALCSIYLYFYLPETKDLTLQEIEEYYKEIRPTLVSQRRLTIQLSGNLKSFLNDSDKSMPAKRRADIAKIKTATAKLEMKKNLSQIKEQENTLSRDDETRSKDNIKSKESLRIETSEEKKKQDSKLSVKFSNSEDLDEKSKKAIDTVRGDGNEADDQSKPTTSKNKPG